MKTAAEISKEIVSLIGWPHSNEDIIKIADLITDFEADIRADQDKVTRHACAEAISGIVGGMDDETLIDRFDAFTACMNACAMPGRKEGGE